MEKIARFIRDLPRPHDAHITAKLFKVTPPIVYSEWVTYRKGKLLHDNRRRIPKRLMASLTWHMKKNKPNPKYSHGNRTRTTVFVVSSASDLKTYMAEHNRKMLEEAMERGDTKTAELFARSTEFQTETFLFPADKFGEIKDFGELEGSQRDTLDHAKPLQDIGYIVLGLPRTLTLSAIIID